MMQHAAFSLLLLCFVQLSIKYGTTGRDFYRAWMIEAMDMSPMPPAAMGLAILPPLLPQPAQQRPIVMTPSQKAVEEGALWFPRPCHRRVLISEIMVVPTWFQLGTHAIPIYTSSFCQPTSNSNTRSPNLFLYQ
ncbi:hypothetical protein GQ44DRAFT_732276 [Phaeosphaeriaceae sp. PMI808]|nr:hypothetical protein GQ44DRAFT_732276 [Phaeosphaeriaceae sp. PMI808]